MKPPSGLPGPPAGMELEREEVMEVSCFRSLNRWGRRGVPRGSGISSNPVVTTSFVCKALCQGRMGRG